MKRTPNSGLLARRPSAGLTLIEALVGLALTGAGMLSLLGVQRVMVLHAESARNVSTAARMATAQLNQMGSYMSVSATPDVVVKGAVGVPWVYPTWDSIVSTPQAPSQAVGILGSSIDPTEPTLTLSTLVDEYSTTASVPFASRVQAPRMKLVTVQAAWTERDGQPRSLAVASAFADIEKKLSFETRVARLPTPAVTYHDRHPNVPAASTRLSGARPQYAFKPFNNSAGAVWVFDNDTGSVVRTCTGVATAQASIDSATLAAASCTSVTAALTVSGTIRFDLRSFGGVVPRSAAIEPMGPSLALSQNAPVALVAGTGSGIRSGPTCFAGAAYATPGSAPALSAVDYHCLIVATAVQGWGGRLEVRSDGSWSTVGSGGDKRVCRYTPMASGAGANHVENRLHPLTYGQTDYTQPTLFTSPVYYNLPQQNFLVIRGDHACPSDVPPTDPTAALGYINANTRSHQPAAP